MKAWSARLNGNLVKTFRNQLTEGWSKNFLHIVEFYKIRSLLTARSPYRFLSFITFVIRFLQRSSLKKFLCKHCDSEHELPLPTLFRSYLVLKLEFLLDAWNNFEIQQRLPTAKVLRKTCSGFENCGNVWISNLKNSKLWKSRWGESLRAIWTGKSD